MQHPCQKLIPEIRKITIDKFRILCYVKENDGLDGRTMTLEQIQRGVEESLRPLQGETLQPLKVDFRKICARYVCSANGSQSLCTRYSEAKSGKCKYFCDGFCEAVWKKVLKESFERKFWKETRWVCLAVEHQGKKSQWMSCWICWNAEKRFRR